MPSADNSIRLADFLLNVIINCLAFGVGISIIAAFAFGLAIIGRSLWARNELRIKAKRRGLKILGVE